MCFKVSIFSLSRILKLAPFSFSKQLNYQNFIAAAASAADAGLNILESRYMYFEALVLGQ
jgi:hypothetical protein